MVFYVILTVLSAIIFMSAAAPISETNLYEDVGEYGEYFEGDMVLTPVQRAEIDNATNFYKDDDNEPRNGLVTCSKRWPNKTVVYHIKEDEFDKKQIEMIHNALSDIANQTCIKFRKTESEDEHAVIIQGKQNGCYSSVGFIGREEDREEVGQVLNLANGCFKHGTIVHEMLHALGFYHMQSTYDRDEFVTIVWENIKQGTEHNFAKYTMSTVTDFGVPYDYGSVMHYSKSAFSINGNETIVPTQKNVTIGQRSGLSKSDVLKLNIMYECPTKETPSEHNHMDIVGIDKFFDFLS